jgi:hypothetical protein
VKRRNWALGVGVAASGLAGLALVAAAVAVTVVRDGTVQTGPGVVTATPWPATTGTPSPVMTANASPVMIPVPARMPLPGLLLPAGKITATPAKP